MNDPLTYHCLKCDKDFQSTSEAPAKCPHCKSMFWDRATGAPQRKIAGRKRKGID